MDRYVLDVMTCLSWTTSQVSQGPVQHVQEHLPLSARYRYSYQHCLFLSISISSVGGLVQTLVLIKKHEILGNVTVHSTTCVTVSEHGSHGASWQTDWQLCFPQLRVLSQTLSHRVATAVAHLTVCFVFPHTQDFVVKAWQGGHGPGWQRMLHRCGQSLRRSLPHTSPQLCGVMYWWNSGSFILPTTSCQLYGLHIILLASPYSRFIARKCVTDICFICQNIYQIMTHANFIFCNKKSSNIVTMWQRVKWRAARRVVSRSVGHPNDWQ